MSTSPPPRDPYTPPYQPAPPGADLRAYLSVIRRRKWSLILVVLVTVGAAAFFSYRQTPMYRSSATVLVKPLNPNQALQGYNYNFSVSMQTEQALVTSPPVAALAAEEAARLGDTWGDTGEVSADVPSETTFLEIAYTAPDPEQAQIWAQSYAVGYRTYRREQAIQLYDDVQSGLDIEIAKIQGKIADLEADLEAALPAGEAEIEADIAVLEARLTDLTRQSSTFPYPVAETASQMIAPAALPSEPYAPNWIRNIAMALAAGLALGLAVVFIRERFDDRLAGRADLEEAVGAPVLAIVPKVADWKKKATKLVARDAPKTPAAEAYRTIRTNVGFMGRANDLRLIAIASPSMGEGKTTTSANLAVALASSGKRVIAVSCDLRKPRLHRFFDLSNERGVTNILIDGLSVPHVAQRVPGLETLRVIASGPIPHTPAELLGSDEMEELLKDLRNYADYVLIDTAPVLVVSDALTIAPKTDGVIIVVDGTRTMRGAVTATREQLELVNANIVGAVINNFDPSKAKTSFSSYRYHYYGDYSYHEAPADAPRRQPRQTPVDPSEMWG